MRRTSIILIFFAICATRGLAQAPATSGPARGTLLLVGGGATLIAESPNPALMHKFVDKFVQLAGGAGARIVFIPTTLTDDQLTTEGLKQLRGRLEEIMGVDHVTVMHTHDRKQADSAEFVAPLRQATGVWIGSGKDAYLLDAYLGTRAVTEIKALLA